MKMTKQEFQIPMTATIVLEKRKAYWHQVFGDPALYETNLSAKEATVPKGIYEDMQVTREHVRNLRQNEEYVRSRSAEASMFREAYEIIRDPNNWCQHTLKVHEGYRRVPVDFSAIERIVGPDLGMHSQFETRMVPKFRFCSAGVLVHLCERGDYGRRTLDAVLNALSSFMGGNVPRYNDSHPHSMVMARWEMCGRAHGWL